MTGTQISYYFHCHRHLWLFSNQIQQEYNSDVVAMGRFISDSTYERKQHEIRVDNISIDFYDAKTKTIHEIKKSDKMEETHIWQVKYYIYVLKQKGVDGVVGVIDYPKLRKTEKVELLDKDIVEIEKIEKEVNAIIESAKIPDVINKPFCKMCAYYDLCFI